MHKIKKLLLFVAVIAMSLLQSAISQDITLTFTGVRRTGGYVRLDSVQVQNINRFSSETVVYPDTVLIFQTSGIEVAGNEASDINAYPNPFNGATNVTVSLPQSGDVAINVYTLSGQKVAGSVMMLGAGKSIFEVRLQKPQVYLLAVTTSYGTSTVKLLNRTSAGENTISNLGMVSAIDKRQSTQPFQSGDVLKIVGYTTHNALVVPSEEVLRPHTESAIYTLSFNLVDVIPTVTTTAASSITANSAVGGGTIVSDGGAAIVAKGVCIDTAHNPTISGIHTSDTSSTGIFVSNITGLLPGTTYYVRAYATNSVGTAYGNEISFTTLAMLPTVITTVASSITYSSAVSGGEVQNDGGAPVTVRGVCWGTAHNPTISDSHTTDSVGIGVFTSRINGLAANTTYYVRAYATNTAGTAYGNEVTFNTDQYFPVGALRGVFSVDSAKKVYFSQGNLQYVTTGTHAVAGGGTVAGTWRFAPNQWDTIGATNNLASSSYSGWIDLFGWATSGWNNGNYFYHPYSTSNSTTAPYDCDHGYGYGPTDGTSYNFSFTDSFSCAEWGIYNAISYGGNAPGRWRTLTKDEWLYLINTRTTASGIRFAKATVNGVGGLIVVPDEWDTNTYSLDSANFLASTFSSNVITASNWDTLESAGCLFLPLSGYRYGTTVAGAGRYGNYWASTPSLSLGSAYALSISVSGVTYSGMYRSYGNPVRLVMDTVTPALPTVTTTAVSDISQNKAIGGGNVTNDGGAYVIARGVCWDTSHNPVLRSGIVRITTTGTGVFTSNINNLIAGKTYYVRAYATNSAGIAYGNEVSFNTPVAVLPTVTTTPVSAITSTYCVGGGSVTSDGGTRVTARGVCWSTSHNPTVSDNHTTNSYGTGDFTSVLEGLSAGTTYYVRAYATSAIGTAYGSEVSFSSVSSTVTGAISGLFSVSSVKQVRFSRGNLQWSATGGDSTATTHAVAGGGTAAGTWRFAPTQWDYVGNDNANASSTYTGWIDLFGWGTSGYHNPNDIYNTNYQPYSTIHSTVNATYNYNGYGPSTNMPDTNLTGTSANYDWGVYNAISNGGNTAGQWRTLTLEEWQYLINYRSTTSGIRYAKACVNNKNGIILVPDNWNTSTYALRGTNTPDAVYNVNYINSSNWSILENAGCVFLPAAGTRQGTYMDFVNSRADYWSSSSYSSYSALYLFCYSGNIGFTNTFRYGGYSVRLVKDAQ